jgi:crotonobetainyl-CoA:carnitine CoA-transferase CaiB-like acyl-CoA transferase
VTAAGDVFADLTVVDLATLAAAPQIAAFFGDFGARVIKVEHPKGDPLRRLVDTQGAATQWKLVNRNKLCVTLDTGLPAGRAVLDRMLARTDVLVSALAAERLAAWGLDDATIRLHHPRIVAVNLTTFGTRGPWANRPGSGTLAEAVGGLAHLTGPADAPPTLSPVGLGDWLGVLQGIIAALVGLQARGRSFDVAMADPVLGLLGQRLSQAARSGADPGRHGNRFPTMAPRNTYPTADGRWVAITAGTDDMVGRLFAAIARPELAQDARFATNLARLANVDALDQVIAAWTQARPCDQVVDALVAARVSAAAIDDLPAVLANAHFRARDALVTVDDADIGPFTTTAPLPLGAGGRIRHLGRGRGADNDAVYREWLGLDAGELADLRAAGVV